MLIEIKTRKSKAKLLEAFGGRGGELKGRRCSPAPWRLSGVVMLLPSSFAFRIS